MTVKDIQAFNTKLKTHCLTQFIGSIPENQSKQTMSKCSRCKRVGCRRNSRNCPLISSLGEALVLISQGKPDHYALDYIKKEEMKATATANPEVLIDALAGGEVMKHIELLFNTMSIDDKKKMIDRLQSGAEAMEEEEEEEESDTDEDEADLSTILPTPTMKATPTTKAKVGRPKKSQTKKKGKK